VGCLGWKGKVNLSPDDFNRKMARLGIRPSNKDTRVKELPKARIDNIAKDVAFEWCNRNLGDAWIWSSPTQTDYTDIYFANKEDAVVFRLTFATA